MSKMTANELQDHLETLELIHDELAASLTRQTEAVNIQVPGLGVAASNRGLRSSVGRGVAVVGERGFRDDCGL